jgi:hypothetical protein
VCPVERLHDSENHQWLIMPSLLPSFPMIHQGIFLFFAASSYYKTQLYSKAETLHEYSNNFFSENFLFIYSHVHTLIRPFLPPTPPLPLPFSPPPHFQAEPVLPLFLILLKRKHKQ